MNLQSEDFDAKQFIAQLIYNSSIDNIKQQIQNFQHSKSTLTNDLQRNVFSNYHEFIVVSHQISQLEKELLELKELMTSMRSVGLNDQSPDQLTMDMDTSTQEEGRRRHEILASQIPELAQFSNEKNRFLIKESTNLALIHPSDKNLAKAIHLLLYNDLFVLGYRKKKNISNKKLTQIESFWPLSKLSVIDVFDSTDYQNCFKIMAGNDTMLISAETADLKKSWLILLRRTIDEYKKHNLSSPLSPTFEAKDLVASISDLPTLMRERYKTISKHDSANPDLVWIHDMPDQLDVFIAHREFDKAIQCVEKANQVLSTYSTNASIEPLRKVLEMRISTLSNILCKSLEHKTNAKTISRLCKLGFSSKARDIFLNTQSSLIHTAIASLPFEGDTVSYIHDLTFLFFSYIKKSIKYYRQFFSDQGLSSGLLTWLRGELQNYWQHFRCQVFHEDQTFEVIGECLSAAREGCGVLREIGVDIGHVFETNAVRRDVVVSLEWFRTRVSSDLAKAVADDEFAHFHLSDKFQIILNNNNNSSGNSNNNVINQYMVSSSTLVFERLVLKFVSADLLPLLIPQVSHNYYSEITESVSSFFELYFRHVLNLSHDGQFLEMQLTVCVQSLQYLSHQLMNTCLIPLMESSGRVIADFLETSPPTLAVNNSKFSMNKQEFIGFQRPVPEWTKLKQRMDAMIAVMISSFVIKRTRMLAKASYAFGQFCVPSGSSGIIYMDYSSDAFPVVDKLCPNESMIQFVKHLRQIELSLKQATKDATIDNDQHILSYSQILKEIIALFLKDMMNDGNWLTQHGYEIVFGYTGLHQFILDLHFMMKLCDAYLTPVARKYGDDLCARALKLYFKRCSDDQKKRRLMGGEFFDRRVVDVLKQPSTGLTKLG